MLLYVGTSGYSYDRWEGEFYPEDLATDDRLGFYAERIGTVRFSLARALWDEGRDRERATAAGREALQDYVSAANGGWDMEEKLQEVRDWLAEHGAP